LVVEQGNKVNELKQAIGTMGDNPKLKVELDVAERDLARFQEFARTDNERLIAMAQVIEREKAWEAYPLHNLARHWRGLALLALGDYKAAILALNGLPANYDNIAFIRYQTAVAAQQAQKNGERKPEERAWFRQQEMAAWRSIPKPGPTADPEEIRRYFLAQ